ncbi:cytochrome d ubiquinol oxidase subunit II [Rhodococcus opacus]|uniref:cytochrome d ubiquinol oxidase subunit II n=1 Tax=Rhodococcus opacus TaxID=37919 RepID=UPI001C4459E3|nr:cytochrome d ubiquinol oxidase subunit II [Rhodococcus opacus]MBV6754843.1 cytochrome d ubiquinol oxidase subunit II [Rhodococcus opacus]
MTLANFWFLAIAVLFVGYLVLEGFDFGVGMLMPILGRDDPHTAADTRRRVVLNTIGPVWDGNEVWLITAVGAMFAAFPDWYATVFSGFYLPLLLILVALIGRVCAIEYRGKIDDVTWRARCDLAIGFGSWIPAMVWGWLFANLVRGVPVGADRQMHATVLDLLNPYALLGAVTTTALFLLHGSAFLTLKTAGQVRADAAKVTRTIAVPALVVTAAFLVWTQLTYGKPWTTWVVGTALLALITALCAARNQRDGVAFAATTIAVAGTGALLFAALFPVLVPSTVDPIHSLTITSAASSPYTLTVLTWCAMIAAPVVLLYQGWTYWVFRRRIAVEHIPASIGLPATAPTHGEPR